MAFEFTNSKSQDAVAAFRQCNGLAENMRSRWTNFLTLDGEKPDRNRDSEFEDAPKTREEAM